MKVMNHTFPLAGVVVLYNPNETVLKTIQSYLPALEMLFVVDNSDQKNDELANRIQKLPHTTYIDNQGNQGIAHALNVGAQLAITKKYQWLLTMDQDSTASPGMLELMCAFIANHPVEKVGILSPFHSLNGEKPPTHSEVETVLTTMTSGNLLNLSAYQAVGPFEEKLFIDYVDHEYCLRLHRHGYAIMQLNTAILQHQLGNFQESTVAGHTVGYTNHNHVRRYYITRNRLYVANKYKDFATFSEREKREFWLEIRKILLFERDKYRKLQSIAKGYRDYKRGTFGKISTRG